MEEVELIASGYEWVCPNCDTYVEEIEILKFVLCPECEKEFGVFEYYHAFGNK